MIDVDLIKLARDRYGSPHHVFRILKRNNIDLLTEYNGGDIIKLPSKGEGAKLSLAKSLQAEFVNSPV